MDQNCTIRASGALGILPICEDEEERASAIINVLADLPIAEANALLDACKKLLVRIRVPKNLSIDFSNFRDSAFIGS